MRASVGELSRARAAPRLPSLAETRWHVVLRRAVGLLSLIVVLYLGTIIVLGSATAPSNRVPARYGGFPSWLRGPLDGISLPLSREGFVLAVIIMIAAYVVALVCVGALRARWTLATVLLLHVVIFLGPPLMSADVMGYVDWARMGALHGLSPYSHDSGSVVSDAVFPFVRWNRFTSPYGPLFTLISYAFVPLGLAGSLWALKATALLASLGICALIWIGAGRLELNRGMAVALYGLNPTVIVYGLGGAHNDLLAMAIVMVGVVLVLYGREASGAAASTLAIAVKASSGVVLPFLVLGAEHKRRAVAAIAAVACVVAGVALAAFGGDAASALGVLGQQQRLEAGTTVIAQLGAVFGWTGDPPVARAVAGVILAVTLVFLLWRTWRGARWLESAGWATFAVLVTTSWLLPWYIVWLVPLAALARGYALRVAAVAFSVFVIITHLSVISDVPTAADIRPLLHPRACTGAHQVGCPGVGRRTVPALLQHALARGFKRAYQAERRVLIGRLGRPPVRRAVRVQCRSRSKAFWTCHVRYVLRGRRDFRYATYSVVVDPRGCFVATSRNFPARLPELVLHRSASNPLARIGSCP